MRLGPHYTACGHEDETRHWAGLAERREFEVVRIGVHQLLEPTCRACLSITQGTFFCYCNDCAKRVESSSAQRLSSEISKIDASTIHLPCYSLPPDDAYLEESKALGVNAVNIGGARLLRRVLSRPSTRVANASSV